MVHCFFFGCWNVAGHYLWWPSGQFVRDRAREYLPILHEEDTRQMHLSPRVHLDGSLAPKRYEKLHEPGISCYAKRPDKRHFYNGEECPQGQFLRHVLDYEDGRYTAISWWDRCQGDTRGACNSTLLLEGAHTSEEMLAALAEHFPHVVNNLWRAGVNLVEVQLG